MIELTIYNMEGAPVGTVQVDEEMFGGVVNQPLLREAVLMYQANRRAGTASTKTRSTVNGSRKKPFRQKGTGRARQGSWVSPHHIGGAVSGGPHPRDYRYAIPKKARLAALKSAYLSKFQTATRVVDRIRLPEPKTRAIVDMLARLGVEGTCLIATFAKSDAVLKSVRNIPGVVIKRIRDVNAHDLLWARHFVVTRQALDSLVTRLAGEAGAATGKG